jgi:dipeptidyl aminopeptidase/acylaminoacyl peptidase
LYNFPNCYISRFGFAFELLMLRILIRLTLIVALLTAALVGASKTLGESMPMGRVIAYRAVSSRVGFSLFDLDRCIGVKLNLPFAVNSASWSPDGSQIAFSGQRSDGSATAEIYVMRLDSAGEIPVTDSSFEASLRPTWMVDGQHIAFWKDSSEDEGLYLAALETGEIQPFPLNTHIPATRIAFAPDGRHAAVTVRNDRFASGVILLNLETGELSPLVNPQFGDARPNWSPDAGRISMRMWSPRGEILQFLPLTSTDAPLLTLDPLAEMIVSSFWSSQQTLNGGDQVLVMTVGTIGSGRLYTELFWQVVYADHLGERVAIPCEPDYAMIFDLRS